MGEETTLLIPEPSSDGEETTLLIPEPSSDGEETTLLIPEPSSDGGGDNNSFLLFSGIEFFKDSCAHMGTQNASTTPMCAQLCFNAQTNRGDRVSRNRRGYLCLCRCGEEVPLSL